MDCSVCRRHERYAVMCLDTGFSPKIPTFNHWAVCVEFVMANWHNWFSQSLRRKTKLLVSNLSACVWAYNTINNPKEQQIINKTHSLHSRCQNWSLLLYTHPMHLHKMFVFTSCFLQKQRKLETSKSGLSCKASEGFSRGVFKSSRNFISFSSVSIQHFDLDPCCPIMKHPEIYAKISSLLSTGLLYTNAHFNA